MTTLSKAARFGLYAAVMMATEEEKVTAARIARELDISEAHVAKVLQQLARARLVGSTRGHNGGYELARPAAALTMLDVVEAIDGPWQSPCTACDLNGSDQTPCSPHFAACGVHDVLAELDGRAFFTLKSVTIATLARRGKRVVRLPQAG